MNIDDFIVPNVAASPAGIPTPSSTDNVIFNTTTQTHAIPVKSTSKPTVKVPQIPPAASVPRSSIPPNRASEFGYVQKRVRKTSIDERKSVSLILHDANHATNMPRIANVQLISLLMSHRLRCPRMPTSMIRLAICQITVWIIRTQLHIPFLVASIITSLST